MKDYQEQHIKGTDVWESSAKGCLAAVGLPFVFLGFIGVAAALGLVRAEDPAPWPVLLSAGLVLLAIGVIFVFGKGGVVIDRRKKKVVKWFGLGMPITRREFPVEKFEYVTFSRSTHSFKSGPVSAYSVGLKGGAETGAVEIETFADFKAARGTAAELAVFLGKSMEDASVGTPVVRSPEELTALGLVAQDGPVPTVTDEAGGPAIEPPGRLRSRVTVEGGETTVIIPERGLDAGGYLSLAIGTAAPVLIVHELIVPFIRQMATSADVLYLAVFYALTIVPTCLTWSGVLRQARRTTRVHASPAGLSLDETGLFKTRSLTVPARDIEELFVTGSAGLEQKAAAGKGAATGGFLLLKSVEGIVVFGHGLSVVELKYLQSVLKSAIAG